MRKCENCGRNFSKSAGCPDRCVHRKWWTPDEMKLGRHIVFRVTSKRLGIDILANEPIRGEWWFTLDERATDAKYYGPFSSKEKAEQKAAEYKDHWKKRLWYL